MKGLLATTSAPGKVILLGEHAVVFGQPAIAAAVNLRLHCRVATASTTTLNGVGLSPSAHPYVHHIVQACGLRENLAIDTRSEIPSGSGLGSSAAVCVALVSALISHAHAIDPQEVATKAYTTEAEVQGRASPTDTSVSTHGQGILVDRSEKADLLWSISRGGQQWFIHHCPMPKLSLVVGYTGVNAPTGPLVAKVKRFYDRTVFARDIVREIGQLTEEGLTRLKANDAVGLGQLMTKDHRLLAVLGVSSKELDRLVEGCLPFSYGAKLTGAGGGGSMIALTDSPDKVSEIIKRRGGTPYKVKLGEPGVRLEKE